MCLFNSLFTSLVDNTPLLVGGLYFKKGLNSKIRLTLMTIMFLGLILKVIYYLSFQTG